MTARVHDFPDALQILAAVREFLSTEVVPSTESGVSFHARVAANLLSVLERELGSALDADERFATQLRSFGAADERQLAELIRNGTIDGDDPRLLAVLHAVTRERLTVSNPRYLEVGETDSPLDKPDSRATTTTDKGASP